MPGRKLEWKWIFDAITMITVMAGVVFGAAELREMRSSQESQSMLQLYQTLQSPDHVRGTDYLNQLPDSLSADSMLALATTGPHAHEIRQVVLTFEAMGVMVYRGDVPIETLGVGDVLGWSWMTAPYRWHFGATARSAARAHEIDAELLREASAVDPVFGYAVACALSGALVDRLQATRARLLDLYGEPQASPPRTDRGTR